mmetsp:Transcript_19408/g.32022  ORF Transcript_19408/g.32022 Transcript_19408/m.32022 type:complete len:236 (-) Transcript_19408:944-1651(-)
MVVQQLVKQLPAANLLRDGGEVYLLRYAARQVHQRVADVAPVSTVHVVVGVVHLRVGLLGYHYPELLLRLAAAVHRLPVLPAGDEVIHGHHAPLAVLVEPHRVHAEMVEPGRDEDAAEELVAVRHDGQGAEEVAIAQLPLHDVAADGAVVEEDRVWPCILPGAPPRLDVLILPANAVLGRREGDIRECHRGENGFPHHGCEHFCLPNHICECLLTLEAPHRKMGADHGALPPQQR